jgi:hypothetical protein
MVKKENEKRVIQENVNAELGGTAIFGTTSNKEIAGYETSGDIENAGNLDKGFKSPEDGAGARASVKGEDD